MVLLTRRTVLTGASLALTAPALIRPARAKTINVTVASLLGEDKPETMVWRRIAERVEASRPGRFRFNIVTNGALGGEKEVAEGVRLGSIQASLSTVASLAGWVPDVQLLDLPFLFRDARHLRRTVEGDVGADLAAKLAVQNFQVGGFIDYGARHLLTKEPVLRPDQIRGEKIRVIQSPLHIRLWSTFGAVPVGIPITETYNALSTGVVDAMDLTISAYAGFKLYEVVPCMTLTGHIRASGVIYYGSAFWNALDEEDRATLTTASREAAGYFNSLIVTDEATSQAASLDHGGRVFQPEQADAWRAGAETVWQGFAPTMGGLDRIRTIADEA